MNKKTLIIILSLAAVAVVLVVASKKGAFGKKGDFEEVEIATIEAISITETVAATGKIQPEIEVNISSEVSGEIIELPIKEGQSVEEGDLLVKINPDLIQSALSQTQAALSNTRAGLEQANASLKEAESNYNRNKTLFDKGIISKAEWDRVLSAYEGAQAGKQSAYYSVQSAAANVSQARDNLNRTTIYAPRSGTISRLNVELGERVVGTQQMAGTEILRVANLNNMEVEVDVNENDIVKVNVGDSTVVEVDAYLKREFKGMVTEIANSADNTLSADQVTNFKVKVRILEESYADLLENKPENYSPFRPGMTATVDIITKKRENVVGVPISAIVIKTDTTTGRKSRAEKVKIKSSEEKQFECVFIAKDGKAKLRVVETGIQDDTNIEILTGLLEGEEVITGPYNTVTKKLNNGDAIERKREGSKDDKDEDN